MSEQTAAILARFSPAEWARSEALGFRRDKLKPAERRWSQTRRKFEALKRMKEKAA